MVRPGYKQTEIGVIPEDWGYDTIGSVVKHIEMGGNYKNSPVITLYPLIKMGNLARGKIDLSTIEYVSGEKPSETHRLRYGNVLLNTRNTPELVGKVAIWKNELNKAYYNSNLLRFVLREDTICAEYLNYVLNTNRMISELKSIAKGTTSVAAIYPRDLYKIQIVLPTKKEQERIAEALSDADDLISSLEKLIEKKKAIKQGAMQQLLTGKKRLPGFEDTWNKYMIEDMGFFYGGLSGKSKKDFGHGKARFITFLNVLSNSVINTHALERVDVQPDEKQNAVKQGDLFFNGSSETPEEVGMCAALINNVANTYLNSFCFGFRLFSEEHDPLFLAYYFNGKNGREIMRALAQGATRYNLSKTSLLKTKIRIPTGREQRAIANVIRDMEKDINTLEFKLEKARLVKQGMMQQLLTGKIRISGEERNA